MTRFDTALAALQQLCKDLDYERVEITVRQDGRVYFNFVSARGFTRESVNADLDNASESTSPTPNHALHRVFKNWSGE